MKRTIKIIIFIIFLTSIITIFNIDTTMAKYTLSQTSIVNANVLIDANSPIIEMTDDEGNIINNENNKTTSSVTVNNIYDDSSDIRESTYKYNSTSKDFDNCDINILDIGVIFKEPGYYELTVIDNAGNVTIVYFQILYGNITDFITEWTITADNTTITLPIIEEPNIIVDWGDGSVETITTVRPTHTYSEGVYLIKISGDLPYWNFKTSRSSKDYITGIKQWGEVNLKSMENAFSLCYNLTGNIPEPTERSFENVTSFEMTFYECLNLTGNIPTNLFMNCPNVTSFYKTFYNCSGITSASINIKDIGNYMFGECSSLTDITIGDNVSSISSMSFYSSKSTVETTLRTNNQLALDYDWSSCNRTIVNTFNI